VEITVREDGLQTGRPHGASGSIYPQDLFRQLIDKYGKSHVKVSFRRNIYFIYVDREAMDANEIVSAFSHEPRIQMKYSMKASALVRKKNATKHVFSPCCYRLDR
jgi:hypothetical protein